MSKSYQDIQTQVNAGNVMDWTNALNRLVDVPIDITSTKETYDEAIVYAATDPVAYRNQIITVAADDSMYIIIADSIGEHEVDGVKYNNYLKRILSEDDLSDAINTALESAQQNGVFDGTSVTITSIEESSSDGGTNTVTFSDGNTMSIKNGTKGDVGPTGPTGSTGPQGPQGIQGETGPQGPSGENGISATHSWDGHVLTITSASGSSSADLKGDKGETGAKGDAGPQGPQGIQGPAGADGKDGVSGVYVGSGDMPEGYNVQIDPDGLPLEIDQTYSQDSQNAQSGRAVSQGINEATTLTFKDTNNGLPSPVSTLDNNITKQTLYWDGTKAAKFYADTDGTTADNPITINTTEELAYVASATYENTYGKYFKIADGIDKIVLQSEAVGAGIVSLDSAEAVKDYFKNSTGTKYTWVSEEYDEKIMCFGGNFDGNGVEIYGMFSSGRAAGGLFGLIDSAVISNVAVKNSYINLDETTENWQFGLIASYGKDCDTSKGDNINYINHCTAINNYIYKRVNDTNGFPYSGVLLGGNIVGNYIIQNCLVYGNSATGHYYTEHYTAYGTLDEEYPLPIIGKTRDNILATDEFTTVHPDWVYKNSNSNNIVKTVLEDSIIDVPLYAYVQIYLNSEQGMSNYHTDRNATIGVLSCKSGYDCLKNVYIDYDLDMMTIDGSAYFNKDYFLANSGAIITKSDIIGDKAIINAPNLAWHTDWFAPVTYSGKSTPFELTQINQSILLNLIGSNQNTLLNLISGTTDEFNNKNEELDNKKCVTSTVVAPGDKITFDFNSLYILVTNNSSADINLCDSSTSTTVEDGDGNGLPLTETCILIMPKNSFNNSDTRMCYFIGFTGSLLLSEAVKSRHFFLNKGVSVYCEPTNKNLSVFKIAF